MDDAERTRLAKKSPGELTDEEVDRLLLDVRLHPEKYKNFTIEWEADPLPDNGPITWTNEE